MKDPVDREVIAAKALEAAMKRCEERVDHASALNDMEALSKSFEAYSLLANTCAQIVQRFCHLADTVSAGMVASGDHETAATATKAAMVARGISVGVPVGLIRELIAEAEEDEGTPPA